MGVEADAQSAGFGVLRDVHSTAVRGRVLSVHGLSSVVQPDDGREFRCAIRGLLKDMSTDLRHVVVAGDIVWLRPEATGDSLIEQIEPRRHILSRTSKRRQQILVANVDQLVIVASAAEPGLKPNLIDRFLVEAERMRIEPILCINKIDLIDPADLQPFVGVYGQMGYQVLLVSVRPAKASIASVGCSPAKRASSPGKAALANHRCSTPSSRNWPPRRRRQP